MSTAASVIVDRAVARNVANRGNSLTSDRNEMLARIRADEQSIITQLGDAVIGLFGATGSFTSSSAASARTIDLTAAPGATIPVERILYVTLPSGTEVRRVDPRDTGAEYSPRYILRGDTMTEVSNDWSASSGTVALTIDYVKRPTDWTVTASDLTQTISLPDRYADLLDNRLARYLSLKDHGRDPSERVELDAEFKSRMDDLIAFAAHEGGAVTRRLVMPPASADQSA